MWRIGRNRFNGTSKYKSREIFLRGYFLTVVTTWISRGRAELDIKRFVDAVSTNPPPSGSLPTPNKVTLPSPDSAKAVTPNPWLPIIETAVVHPDDHLVKLQRALAHYASLYGSRQAGLPDFKNTELPSADLLDGSFFIRVAGLSAKSLGRIREGEEVGEWSFGDARGSQ